MFRWTRKLADAAKTALLGDGWEDARVITSDVDVRVYPGVYEITASDAEVAIRKGRWGTAIATDSSDIPTEGIYLAPGQSHRWAQFDNDSVRIEPASGAKATFIRRYTG